MKIKQSFLGWKYIYSFGDYILCRQQADSPRFLIRSMEDFQEVTEIQIDLPGVLQYKTREHILIIHSLSRDCHQLYRLDFLTLNLESLTLDEPYRISGFNNSGEYVLSNRNNKGFYFADADFRPSRRLNLKQSYALTDTGVLYYNINKYSHPEDNSILYEDIKSGYPIWQLDFTDKIKKCLIWNGHFLLKTILDGKSTLLSVEMATGEIKWKFNTVGHFMLFAPNGEALLVAHSNVLETIDLSTGQLLSRHELKVEKLRHFVAYLSIDETGVYYIYGVGGEATQFGKIDRSSGVVNWEYHFEPTELPQNIVRHWIGLNNQQHVLGLDRPNSEPYLILMDPMEEENQKLRTIIDDQITDLGIAIKERHARKRRRK